MLTQFPLSPTELAALSHLDIFSGLSSAELDALCASMRRRTYHRGEVIHRIDDLAGDVFLIVHGHVKHRQLSPDGRQITHRIHGPGDVFGMLSVLDHRRRTGDAVALTDCEVLVIDRDCFADLSHNHPEAVENLLDYHVASLRRMQELVYDLVFLSAPARLAKTLVRYASEQSPCQTGALEVPAYLNQTELAYLVGASRETVNQCLKAFVRRGWIEISGRQICILKAEELRRLAE